MINFNDEEKAALVQKIQAYFDKSHDIELGQFDAEFVLQFFSEEVGVYFYNRGLLDAQAVLSSRMDIIEDAIYELEQPTELRR